MRMVVFVNYDSDSYDDERLRQLNEEEGARATNSQYTKPRYPSDNNDRNIISQVDGVAESPQLCDALFSRCLSCYPVVRELAQYLDLNSLDALSRTCRQNRANLMPFRRQLVKQTLRCENEYIETLNELLSPGTAIPESVKHIIHLMNRDNLDVAGGRLTSGKIGKCARDMVGECRRCSKVVCRNCIIKPSSAPMLKNRLRRLCKTCRTAPLVYHLSPETNIPSTATRAFTFPAFARTPCQCEYMIWLCHTCGHSVRNNDTTYRRVWTWRTRYGAYLGAGLGTGIGEGCQGVKCGKEEKCLASQAIELEVDSEATDESIIAIPHHNHDLYDYDHTNGYVASPPIIDGIPLGERSDNHQHEDEPGYLRQEIVGIGGVVKQKIKKRVTVGACVEEFDDERETGKYLHREETGQERSWCGWCWRVVPSRRDLELYEL